MYPTWINPDRLANRSSSAWVQASGFSTSTGIPSAVTASTTAPCEPELSTSTASSPPPASSSSTEACRPARSTPRRPPTASRTARDSSATPTISNRSRRRARMGS
jgi:hypothetical protein